MDNDDLAFLQNASDVTLGQYELNQQALAADLLKQSRELFFKAAQALSQAKAARFLREHRGQLLSRTLEGVYLSFPSAAK